MRISFAVMLVAAVMPGYAQYGFDLGCIGDTVQIAYDTTAIATFYFYLQNTGSSPDSYAVDCRVVDSVPGWEEMFCVGGNCGVPGMILYDHLAAGEVDSNIDVQVFLNAEYGVEVLKLKVTSVGDPGLCDSVNVYVKKEMTVCESKFDPLPRMADLVVEPNPARGSACIWLRVEGTGHRAEDMEQSAGNGKLRIFDASGRLVRSFAFPNSPLVAHNSVTWHCDDDQGRPAPAGVYFIRLDLKNGGLRKKIVVLE